MSAPDPIFSSLTAAERNLVRLMQSIGCGRLRHLTVKDGQPTFQPPLTAVRIVNLRKVHLARSQPVTVMGTSYPTTDFSLRREVINLLTQIRAMKSGIIDRLEILHGLPTAVEIGEPLALASTSLPPTSTPSPES
jgi:hypothetical protein